MAIGSNCSYMDIIQEYINQIIYSEIKGKSPRDKDFGVSFYAKKIEKINTYIKYPKVVEELYRDYLLGYDLLAILNNETFYKNLNITTFQSLFKIEESPSKPTKINSSISKKVQKKESDVKDIGSLEFPPTYKIIKEQIPNVRKQILDLTLAYIASKELMKWLNEKKFDLPSCITKDSPEVLYNRIINGTDNRINGTDNIKLEQNKDANSKNEQYKRIISKNLETFNSKKALDENNFNSLFDLLFNFIVLGESATLNQKITVGRCSVKVFAYYLGRIFTEIRQPDKITKEYIVLWITNINKFSKYEIHKDGLFSTCLYKYCSAMPKRPN